MLKEIRSFYTDSIFRVIVYEDKVDIVNYLEIDHFDDSKILIRYESGMIVVKGDKLIISKLLDDEILINGVVKSVEFK